VSTWSYKRWVVSFGLCLVAAVAAAADPPPPETDQPTAPAQKKWRGLIGAGLTWGGDELARVIYTDGSTDHITAGGEVHMYAGLEYRLDPAVSLQATLGLHLDSARSASNAGLSFSRVPLELLVYRHVDEHLRFGAGLRLVSGARLKGTGLFGGIDRRYGSTLGLVLEAEYLFDHTIGIKLRHVSESYQETFGGPRYSGDHWGLMANFYF